VRDVNLELRVALRVLAEALPTGSAIPVPREALLELVNGDGEAPGHDGAPVPAPEPGDRLLSAKDAASRLGVSVRYLYQHRADFTFTKHLPGGAPRFSEVGLVRWIKGA
jgi:hypothetical protein